MQQEKSGEELLYKMLKCKKIFYNNIDESIVLAYSNSEKIEGDHHNEV